MNLAPMGIPDVIAISAHSHADERGFFAETYRSDVFAEAGIDVAFVQDNHTRSRRGVLRGLHYQIRSPQGKLIRTVAGEVFDVAVDLRASSPTFGQWVGERLSADNMRMLWIPPGFAHGFLVLTDWAEVLYKVTDYYAPEWERTLIWNDPAIGIRWPLSDGRQPILSPKDAAGLRLQDLETFA
jgi:dTDP-4-dehydrorhamnose 3,5-epimerase